MKIIISGGGIGGLTAALCALSYFSHQVTVLERAPALGAVGAGVKCQCDGTALGSAARPLSGFAARH